MSQKPEKTNELQAFPLLSHAIELRRRLMISLFAVGAGFVVCYVFAPEIYSFLVKPLAGVMKGEGRRLIYTGPAEAFVTYMKLALWGGTMLAFPVIAAQLWFFAAPGLYKEEKSLLLPFLCAVPLLFLAGSAMAYYLVFPAAWSFFLSFEASGGGGALPIQMEARVSEYLSLAMSLIFAFGLAFQMPIFGAILANFGMIKADFWAKNRRFGVVLIFVFAAIATPPDVFSQLALAFPMMGLYEVTIWIARLVEKGKKKRKEI